MGSIDYNPEAQSAATSAAQASSADANAQSPQELEEERRKIRRLQIVVNMVMQVIAQDPNISLEEASEMVADTRRMALGMFPDKELAFNLIFWPRLQRLMRERFRMQ
jgi:citrate synthase